MNDNYSMQPSAPVNPKRGLQVRPCSIREARLWTRATHRHLPNVQGGLWAVQLLRDGERVGVAIVGHPARVWMADGVLAVLRVAVVEGVPSGCSMLLGACARAARAMGASDLVTYTLADEPGTSLRAAGWVEAGWTDGGEHSRLARPRKAAVDSRPKRRWLAPWGERAKASVPVNLNRAGTCA